MTRNSCRFLSVCLSLVGATAIAVANLAAQSGAPAKPLVLVAGATGRTGQEIIKILQQQGYPIRALVRDRAAAETTLGKNIEYAVGDVREPRTLEPAAAGVAYLLCAIGSSPEDPTNSAEHVDYGGVKNLADAARRAGVKQFVLVSSLGVGRPEDTSLQRRPNYRPDVAGWKLKGEDHLRSTGVAYTIIRPGRLMDEPGGRQGIWAQQSNVPLDRDARPTAIPRADLAAIMVHALGNPDAVHKTFEVVSDPASTGVDWGRFFKSLTRDNP